MPGTFQIKSDNEIAYVPYVIEAWAEFSECAKLDININRTPITGDVSATHSKTHLCLSGCNLSDEPYTYPIDIGRRPVNVVLNVITPHMPITSESKLPNLRYLRSGITDAIKKSIGKAKRNIPKSNSRSQKEIVIENIPLAAKEIGNGHCFSLRQLYYAIRPIVKTELNEELAYGHFTGIVTEYEEKAGEDIPDMYRDGRGALYHPHLHEQIALSTQMIESYQPPKWTFNKILYIEKEGFFPVLKDEMWPEKHDCALLTSKGYASRAAKDLIDGLGDSEEEITFYCIHDADAYGTTIYQALQEATKARPARKVKVVNLGLEPEEGLANGLESERIKQKRDKMGKIIIKPVAEYVSSEWADWLQTHRIELNAMSTPQFLQWLDDKMEEHDQCKLIAPADIMTQELHDKAREILTQTLIEEILEESDLEGRVNREYAKLIPILDEKANELTKDVTLALQKDPVQSWRDPVLKVAVDVVESSNP